MLILPLLELLEDPNDEPEFNQFVHRFENIAMHVAKEYLDDHDFAQEAIWTAFAYLAKDFKEIKDLPFRQQKTRVCSTTAERAINIWNREKKHRYFTEEYDDSFYYSAAAEFNFKDIRMEELLEAINNVLNPEDRQYFYLHHLYKKTTKEIAKSYGVTDAKVRKRLQRAREKLRNYLEVKIRG